MFSHSGHFKNGNRVKVVKEGRGCAVRLKYWLVLCQACQAVKSNVKAKEGLGVFIHLLMMTWNRGTCIQTEFGIPKHSMELKGDIPLNRRS